MTFLQVGIGVTASQNRFASKPKQPRNGSALCETFPTNDVSKSPTSLSHNFEIHHQSQMQNGKMFSTRRKRWPPCSVYRNVYFPRPSTPLTWWSRPSDTRYLLLPNSTINQYSPIPSADVPLHPGPTSSYALHGPNHNCDVPEDASTVTQCANPRGTKRSRQIFETGSSDAEICGNATVPSSDLDKTKCLQDSECPSFAIDTQGHGGSLHASTAPDSVAMALQTPSLAPSQITPERGGVVAETLASYPSGHSAYRSPHATRPRVLCHSGQHIPERWHDSENSSMGHSHFLEGTTQTSSNESSSSGSGGSTGGSPDGLACCTQGKVVLVLMQSTKTDVMYR